MSTAQISQGSHTSGPDEDLNNLLIADGACNLCSAKHNMGDVFTFSQGKKQKHGRADHREAAEGDVSCGRIAGVRGVNCNCCNKKTKKLKIAASILLTEGISETSLRSVRPR